MPSAERQIIKMSNRSSSMVNILLQEYAGKLIKQTREESVVYIDDFMILEKLFNTQEKERQSYNRKRLKTRLEKLNYEENTLIGKLIIVKIYYSINNNKTSFTISPSCERLASILKTSTA